METPKTGVEGLAPRMHAIGPVAFAMLLVVASFAATLAYSHLRLEPVTAQALAVIEGAMPSIEHLSGARTELTRMEIYLSEVVGGTGNSTTLARADVDAARRQLSAELHAYRTTVTFPREEEGLSEVVAKLALLDEATGQALDETAAGHTQRALGTMHAMVNPRLLATDEALAALKTLNVQHASAAGHRILGARRHATLVATTLGATSLGIAIAATALVLRALRSRARLMEEHARLLAARASELEAFAGRVAHDLKNPLGAIALRVVAVGRAGDLSEKARDGLDKATRQVARMDRIIDGLLEFARAGAGPAPGAAADLAEVLGETVAEVRPKAESAGIDLWVEPFAPVRLACTPAALTSVLSNLLGNAVKYVVDGTQRPLRVTARVKRRADTVRVEIEDNGPGLPPEAAPVIFEPFRRYTDSKPGMGLGLATVKKLVEAYGGHVGLVSKLQEGSTFWFELPEAPNPPAIIEVRA